MKTKQMFVGAGALLAIVAGCRTTGADVRTYLALAQSESARIVEKTDKLADKWNEVEDLEDDWFVSLGRHGDEITELKREIGRLVREIATEAEVHDETLGDMSIRSDDIIRAGEEHGAGTNGPGGMTVEGGGSGVVPPGGHQEQDFLQRGKDAIGRKKQQFRDARSALQRLADGGKRFEKSFRAVAEFEIPKEPTKKDAARFKAAFGQVDRKAVREMEKAALDLFLIDLMTEAELVGDYVERVTSPRDVIVRAKSSVGLRLSLNLDRNALGPLSAGDVVVFELPQGFSFSEALGVECSGCEVTAVGNAKGSRTVFFEIRTTSPDAALRLKTNQAIAIGRDAQPFGTATIAKIGSTVDPISVDVALLPAQSQSPKK